MKLMNAAIYKNIFRPFLFQMDAEQAHLFIHRFARQNSALLALFRNSFTYTGKDLVCNLFGQTLSNPVGLAAGFDKNGDLVGILGALGFGFAEIGSITALAKAGNPRPRLFRLPEDKAVINRMGLNGEGANAISDKLQASKFSLPIGLNVAKTNDPNIIGDAAIQDMVYTFSKIKDLPLSYVTINASCPNTKEGIETESTTMHSVFVEIQKINSKKLPILVKLSPDSSQELLEGMVNAATSCGLSGFVCGNTTTSRDGLTTDSTFVKNLGMGGLSGPPLKTKALKVCEAVFSLKQPSQIIIGCGGIVSGRDAYEFIAAGASFVQIYTGLVYEGPMLPRVINEELSRILDSLGLRLSEAVGTRTVQAVKRK